jgi:hypothetical protein
MDYYPHLSALLTDIDIDSCLKLKNIIGFEDVDFKKFDIKSNNYRIFDRCDVLTMWGVDYIFSDLDLISFFKYINSNNKVLILATVDCEKNFKFNPKALINKLIYTAGYRRRSKNGILRSHGVVRTKSYIYKLAFLSGVSVEEIQNDFSYRIFKVF